MSTVLSGMLDKGQGREALRNSCPLTCPNQNELDLLLRAGVDIMALARPLAMQVACGTMARDGLFDPHPRGERWFAFEEPTSNDIVFWHWRTSRLSSWTGRTFALGQEVIDQAATYSFSGALRIFSDPLAWLVAGRDGIVILPGKWLLAFDRLRDAPRIAIAEQLLPLYRRHMKPSRMPQLLVVPQRRCAA